MENSVVNSLHDATLDALPPRLARYGGKERFPDA